MEDFKKASEDEVGDKADKIINRFIKEDSRQEINVPGSMVKCPTILSYLDRELTSWPPTKRMIQLC